MLSSLCRIAKKTISIPSWSYRTLRHEFEPCSHLKFIGFDKKNSQPFHADMTRYYKVSEESRIYEINLCEYLVTVPYLLSTPLFKLIISWSLYEPTYMRAFNLTLRYLFIFAHNLYKLCWWINKAFNEKIFYLFIFYLRNFIIQNKKH